MNYFAHGRDYVDKPYFLVGTAVPDWLSVIDRRMRARRRHVAAFLDDQDRRVAEIASGILQLLHDDRWFHQTRAFAELSLQLTRGIRGILPDDSSFRPSFLGHILVEILLDGVLIEQQPDRLDEYYAAFDRVDRQVVEESVNRMATRQSDLLAAFISRFLAERFLYDYLDDEKLLWRLNHVMRRVNLTRLPNHFLEIFPEARRSIRRRREELLAGEPGTADD
ncbi:MAG: hypothetical protein JJ992_28315, partial [Planctomycetes bacterium]|nr:hypothetical protein [Planctomycetota bacterium]